MKCRLYLHITMYNFGNFVIFQFKKEKQMLYNVYKVTKWQFLNSTPTVISVIWHAVPSLGVELRLKQNCRRYSHGFARHT